MFALGLFALACGEGAPPRNPLDDRGVTPVPTATASAVATAVDGTPVGAPATPDVPPEQERVVGMAIEMAAEWLGISPSALEPVSVERVRWSSSCLGVERAGIACAEVITPGFRVVLRSRLNTLHELHADRSAGRFAWAPRFAVEATVVDLEPAAGRLRVGTAEGETELHTVPGTREPDRLADLAVGDAIEVYFDPSPSAQGEAVLVDFAPS